MSLSKKGFPYSHWQFLNSDTGDSLRIVPERGGLITSWYCNGRENFYFDVDRFLQRKKSIRGGMPVLFPICGALESDCLSLPQGDFLMPQHGFARDIPWCIEPFEDKSGFLLKISDTDKTRNSYPFSFLVEMLIRLKGNALEINTLIKNNGHEPMPFSFGLHPYFKVGDLGKVTIKGLPEKCINHKKMSGDVTEHQLQNLSKGVDFITNTSEPITLIDCDEGREIELHHQSPMDLTVIWTDPPRQMVCLEPWTSPRHSLITGDRMLLLDPGASQELNCRFLSN